MSQLNPDQLEILWREFLGNFISPQLISRLVPRVMIDDVDVEDMLIWSNNELGRLKRTIQRFIKDYQVNPSFVQEFTSKISTQMLFNRFPNASNDDLMVFRSYFLFVFSDMIMLKSSHNDPNEFNDEIYDAISETELMDHFRQLFCQNYEHCENVVVNDGLVVNGNVLDTRFKFSTNESATYHWYKHSVEDIYGNQIRDQNRLLITPLEYLEEANHVIDNHGNGQRVIFVAYPPDSYQGYISHRRKVVINNENGNVLSSYYKEQ